MQNKELLVCHPKLWAAEAGGVLQSVTRMGFGGITENDLQGAQKI